MQARHPNIKEFTLLDTNQTERSNAQLSNRQDDLKEYFSKENIQMANVCITKELDVTNHQGTVNQKTPCWYHLTLIRIAITKTARARKCWLRCGEKRMLAQHRR